MLFNSTSFLIFFPIVVLFYYVLPFRFRNIWLLIASYYFYMSWDAMYSLLILFSTVSTYLCAGIISRYAHNGRIRKSALAVNVAVNIGILFLFKYYVLFSGLSVSFFSLFGVTLALPTFSLLLPVGISFYTFQALGYSIDVYRNTVKHEKNFLDYALFVSFFPQLVAGPIERSTHLLKQLKSEHELKSDNFSLGVRIMFFGYFKKLVVADNISMVIDRYYSDVSVWPAPITVIMLMLFAMQVYCDFSAYSDIARGAAKVLGIDLMHNFNHPYTATSIKDFWARWHISLSTWFRDYLYFPLGGSRKGKARERINILIVFLASGLWHGANLTFVIWGLLHGLCSVAERGFASFKEKMGISWKLPKVLATAAVFLFVCFAYIFFRSTSVMQAWEITKGLFVGWGSLLNFEMFSSQIIAMFETPSHLITICFSIAVLLFVEYWEVKKNTSFEHLFANINRPVRWGTYYALFMIIALLGNFQSSAFIYFQF